MIWKKIDKSICDDSIGKSFEETISDESSSRIKSKYLQICIIFFSKCIFNKNHKKFFYFLVDKYYYKKDSLLLNLISSHFIFIESINFLIR